ncbi:uncharacterized protein RJT20DRAFT_48175 [Scheffersomyces xylosifermentans]|uniref:uncharacterized protein n=1 Tax=Scheffersomyces xylosifermentans TaxID=1304137 RepID=UPI00315CE5BC
MSHSIPAGPPPEYEPQSAPIYSQQNEKLPSYKPSVEFFGLSLIKSEFLTPYHYNNGSRSWKPVILELNSTQLNIYSLNADKKLCELILVLYNELNSLNELVRDVNNTYKSHTDYDSLARNELEVDLFAGDAYGDAGLQDQSLINSSALSKLKAKHRSYKANKSLSHDLTKYHSLMNDNQLLFEPVTSTKTYNMFKSKYQGELLDSFTLANLSVGEAPSLNQLISAMYKEENIYDSSMSSSLVKYKNVLRLRIEYKQILLQFWSFYGMIHWFRMLSIGKDLSSPIESRNITKLKSIPSRYSNRNNALLAATAAAASYRRRSDPLFGEEDDEEAAVLGSQLIEFSDPFSSTRPKIRSSSPAPSDSVSTGSVVSSAESIFEPERRESVVSNNTSISSIADDPCKYTTTIHNFKFVCYDKYHTALEKQYISNCIPDLNSYDKWSGKNITLSNYEQFIKSKDQNENDDIFINYTSFMDVVHSYEKKKHQKHAQHSMSGVCRNFMIHQRGLVGVALERVEPVEN